jgi:hypothetical protein
MNATPPEANTEYSRVTMPSRLPERPRTASRDRLLTALALGALAGAILLLVAEFTTLYSVHTSVYHSRVRTVSAGSHNGYALVPVALLAAALAIGPVRLGVWPGAAALLAAGLIALGIALLGDLPDTHARGLTSGLALASSAVGPALYLETLGAVVLIFTGGLASLMAFSRRGV